MDATKRQIEVLRWLVKFHNKHGYTPTVREIGRNFGWTSTKSPRTYLDRFRENGWITAANGLARAYAVTPKGRRASR